jgi:cytochrome c oxidase subunit II
MRGVHQEIKIEMRSLIDTSVIKISAELKSMKWMLLKILFLLPLMSCKKPFSALYPAGDAARTISDMMWWLFGGALIIWLLFIAIELYAVIVKPGPHSHKKTRLFVIGGGALFPVIIITISIYYSLLPLPKLLARAPEGSLTVKVSGLQWWWRVKYLQGDKEIDLANEIWLPVNEPVQFLLSSEDVIHSFWIPSLGGKMDMIPGRTTHLAYTPTQTGEFLGICAEYCGASHALMRLNVKVVERKVFDEWMNNQKKDANPSPHEGQTYFIKNGCISCHTVRGISEIGRIGPDLTHVGSRMRIGAGIMANNVHTLKKLVKNTSGIKPEVKMPDYDNIPEHEREVMAEWLEGLK